MTHNRTASGGVAAGIYSPNWPDGHELQRIAAVASAAISGIRKPAVPLAFEPTAQSLQDQLNSWYRMPDEERSDRVVEQLLATRDKLISEVQAYFTRQRKFPFKRGMPIESYRGIPAHDEDGLLEPGLYHAEWEKFVERFATNSTRRRKSLALLAAMHLYRDAGAPAIDIGGSFVTAKTDPGDIDVRVIGEGLDLSRLDPMLWPDRTLLKADDYEWSCNRRLYFGLDIGFAEQELHHRTFCEFMFDFPEEFGDCPTARSVGVVRIDLTKPLPAADGFVPFAWHGDRYWEISDMLLEEARRRLPQHWEQVTDEMLESHGARIHRILRWHGDEQPDIE